MKIASVLENQKIEKRIAITPDIAKKYLSLGFEVALSENYGSHLGIKDHEYTELGVKIFMVFVIHKNYFCLALNFGLVLFIM